MIHHHPGDKEGVFTAVLEERIFIGQSDRSLLLGLEALEPEEALPENSLEHTFEE